MEQAQLTSFFAYGGYRPIDSDFLLSDSNIPSDPSDSQSCITTLLFFYPYSVYCGQLGQPGGVTACYGRVS